jgi:hypothetical protein
MNHEEHDGHEAVEWHHQLPFVRPSFTKRSDEQEKSMMPINRFVPFVFFVVNLSFE